MKHREEIRRALQTLATLSPKGAVDYLYGAAMDTGGFLTLPDPRDNTNAQTYEGRAYGVYASGKTEAELQRNWQRAAANELAALKALAKAEATVMAPTMETSPADALQAAEMVLTLGASHPEARAAMFSSIAGSGKRPTAPSPKATA